MSVVHVIGTHVVNGVVYKLELNCKDADVALKGEG